MANLEIGGASPLFIVRNVPATLAFYRDMLGFEITFQGPEEDDIFFGIVQRYIVVDVADERARARSSTITVLVRDDTVVVRGVRLLDDIVHGESGWLIERRRHQPAWEWQPVGKNAGDRLVTLLRSG